MIFVSMILLGSLLAVIPVHSENINEKNAKISRWQMTKDFTMEVGTSFTAHSGRLLFEKKMEELEVAYKGSLVGGDIIRGVPCIASILFPVYVHEKNNLGGFGHAAANFIGFSLAVMMKSCFSDTSDKA